jgi:hypothetical protein
LGNWGNEIYAFRIESDYKDRPISDPQAVEKQLKRARDFEVTVSQQNKQSPPPPL